MSPVIPFAVPMLLAAACSCGLIFLIYQRGFSPASRVCILFLACIAVWCFGTGIELLASGVEAKVVASKLVYLGICFLPSLWFLFCWVYTRSEPPPAAVYAFLFALPPITLGLVLTNEWHRFFWRDIGLVDLGGRWTLDVIYGSWFWWVHTPYSYFWILAGVTLLIRELSRNPKTRPFTILLLVAAAIPVVANLVYISVPNISPVDLTPIAFFVSSIILATVLLRSDMLDLTPVALNVVFRNLPDSVVVLDRENRVVTMNPAAEKVLDLAVNKARGKAAQHVFDHWPGLGEDESKIDSSTLELSVGSKSSERHMRVRTSSLRDHRGRVVGRVLLAQDISESKKFEEMAYRDPLTGLANRRLFDQEGERALRLAGREKWSAAIVYVDLNGFKEINDRYGHKAGDAALETLAGRISESVRGSDLLARVGGDEFVLLLNNTDLRHAAETCGRILHAFEDPVITEGTQVQVGVSIGIAIFPEDAETLDELMTLADEAMYQAKADRSGFRFHHAGA